MDQKVMLTVELFLDTSYAVALSVPNDQNHTKALLLADELESNFTRLVTTRAVILEIGNALSRQRYRHAAAELLQSLEEDPRVEIIELTPSLYNNGLRLYRERQDKDWGITDCLTFVVMADRGLGSALTADNHFCQAGFHALLKEEQF
jgi:predicted nucleic acid-binding protein